MLLLFFFFKQKTAYEMRISDWSSDVCSSDLGLAMENRPQRVRRNTETHVLKAVRRFDGDGFALIVTGKRYIEEPVAARAQALADPDTRLFEQIGRASCRERVCQYV